ncbi:hypothetical protein BJ508DRAFT_325120 [Ascobolus immersus RN42]|uniref:Uncharacterized protein n=1 Tax=Ascobolus immersus RN42 TaxID=1160509 RepID=A0A3N4IA58_ASCIM|nr:hypothetical protein BJ508DRAFT_325120 [Ascobolus immersus RN42]
MALFSAHPPPPYSESLLPAPVTAKRQKPPIPSQAASNEDDTQLELRRLAKENALLRKDLMQARKEQFLFRKQLRHLSGIHNTEDILEQQERDYAHWERFWDENQKFLSSWHYEDTKRTGNPFLIIGQMAERSKAPG